MSEAVREFNQHDMRRYSDDGAEEGRATRTCITEEFKGMHVDLDEKFSRVHTRIDKLHLAVWGVIFSIVAAAVTMYWSIKDIPTGLAVVSNELEHIDEKTDDMKDKVSEMDGKLNVLSTEWSRQYNELVRKYSEREQ